MCFSASVSFSASAALLTAGVFALRQVQYRDELPFASIPLLFAVQQFLEGMLWMTLPKAGFGQEEYWLTQVYAVFVGMVWPMLIPFSLSLIEPAVIRKRFMQLTLILGAGIAFFTLNIIMKYGVSAEIANECIVYDYPGDTHHGILTVYMLATCAAYFFSSFRMIRWIGIANLAGLLIAHHFYRVNYASVWCFFSAIISVMIYLYFSQRAKYKIRHQTAV